MAEFKNPRVDYRDYGVVDIYEGDVHIATISLHDFAITIQSNLPPKQMETTINEDWPESVIIKFRNTSSS